MGVITLQRGELNLVPPLATVIKQRVRCTEAKLIWSFDDKGTTFIPPTLAGRTGEATEDREMRTLRENNNFCYIYVNTVCREPCDVLHSKSFPAPTSPLGLSQSRAGPITSNKVRLGFPFMWLAAGRSYGIGVKGHGVPEELPT